ncbi:MAG: CBS domain-containing protein [Firmicutes bacterium]|nr:CBS domain-containing protein [Bacillota bacterium]
MNIAFFLHPKGTVDYLYDDITVRQAIEKLRVNGYTAIPVISRDGVYVTTIAHGDLLWYLWNSAENTEDRSIRIRELEKTPIMSIVRKDKNPPCFITDKPEDLVFRAMEQNFIPVVDDTKCFIGIVTRRDILKYLATSTDKNF